MGSGNEVATSTKSLYLIQLWLILIDLVASAKILGLIQREQKNVRNLLLACDTVTLNLRSIWKFRPVFKTNRSGNSFVTFNALKA